MTYLQAKQLLIASAVIPPLGLIVLFGIVGAIGGGIILAIGYLILWTVCISIFSLFIKK